MIRELSTLQTSCPDLGPVLHPATGAEDIERLDSSSHFCRALYPWVMRRVECVRGQILTKLECFPAFNYAQDKHTTEISEDGSKVTFTSKDLTLELLAVSHSKDDIPAVSCKFLANSDIHGSGLGDGVTAEFDCEEGQVITFILREPIKSEEEAKAVYFEEPDVILEDTASYWTSWLSQSSYKGRWRESVSPH